MRRRVVAAVAAFACGFAPLADADLGSAFKAYDAKDYERAYTEFHELAQLGSSLAQVNTGMMTLNGEGVTANAVTGYGWILAASDNDSAMATQLVKELQGKFTAEQADAAKQHAAIYGRAGTRWRLFPQLAQPEIDPATFHNAEPDGVQRLVFPSRAAEQGTVGFVELAAILGADGRVHDAWITSSLPQGIFDDSLLEAAREWRFRPGRIGDRATPLAFVQHRRFGYLGEEESDRPRVQKFVRERRAEANSSRKPSVQYQLARLLMAFPDLRAQADEIWKLVNDAAQRSHPPSQQFLGLCILRREGKCAELPRSDGLDLLAKAAQSGDPSAQLDMALLALADGSADGPAKAVRWLDASARRGHPYASKYLASVLAAAPTAELRDPKRAHFLIEPLLKRGRMATDPDAWQIQAAAYAGEGSFPNAIEAQEKSVQLAKRWSWDTTTYEQRLIGYRGGTPWYGDLLGLSGLQWGPEPVSGVNETCGEVAEVGSRLSRCNRQQD